MLRDDEIKKRPVTAIAVVGPKKLFPVFGEQIKTYTGKSGTSVPNLPELSEKGGFPERATYIGQSGNASAFAETIQVGKDINDLHLLPTSAEKRRGAIKVAPLAHNSAKTVGEHYECLENNVSESAIPSLSSSPMSPPLPSLRDVINITDSPIREMISIKTFSDFHAERLAGRRGYYHNGLYEGMLAPWPSSDTLHVLPPLETIRWRSKNLSCLAQTLNSWKGKARDMVDVLAISGSESLRSKVECAVCVLETGFSCRHDSLGTPFDADTLAFAAAEPHLPKGSARLEAIRGASKVQLWITAYAPHSAAEVLGEINRDNAFYLSRWIRELGLQDSDLVDNKTKLPLKRKVQRELSKRERRKRKRDEKRQKTIGYTMLADHDLGNFIASDSDVETDSYDQPDDPEYAPSASSPQQSPSFGTLDSFRALTNVILLCGPHGSGKTSTVYAVAEELDWQVFEVFPGIGKRSFKDIERYIGMLGQNHTMASEDGRKGIAETFRSEIAAEKSGSNGASVNIAAGAAAGLHLKQKRTLSQALILIDEADIIFPSDYAFWDGIMTFLAKSHRPVILTCNDSRSIPCDLLPLQAVLKFCAPPKEAVLPFLCGIACSHGVPFSHGMLENLYEKSCTSACPSENDARIPDLRRCLNQLQLICAGGSTSGQAPSIGNVMHGPAHALTKPRFRTPEDLSFADAEVRRKPFMLMEDHEILPNEEEYAANEYPKETATPCSSPIQLPIDRPLPYYALESECFEAIVGVLQDDKCATDMAEFCSALAILWTSRHGRLISGGISDRFMHIDILPTLRHIVAAEDFREITSQEDAARSREEVGDTRLRRSLRLLGGAKDNFSRYLGMQGEMAECIRRSGL